MKTILVNKILFYFFFVFLTMVFIVTQATSTPNNLVKIVFVMFYLLYIPGYLLSKAVAFKTEEEWDKIIIRVGLSLSFALFYGLLINTVLPHIGITKPLTNPTLLISYSVAVIFLSYMAYVWDNEKVKKVILPGYNKLSLFLIFLSSLLPILSIGGAFLQNNNGGNFITLSVIGLVGLFVLLVTGFSKKIHGFVFPFTILMISVATLYLFSMRSWYISGFDISQEYRLFLLTKNFMVWNFNNFLSAYNACLSITILPTIFSLFTDISDQYVYKLLYPGIFAFTPVVIFLFAKRLTNTLIAFLCAIFYLSQVWFVDPMVTLARQEIAFFFFILLLFTLFNSENNWLKKQVLLITFGFSMVVSHYSTTYLAIVIFVSVYFMEKVVRLLWHFNEKLFFRKHFKITYLYKYKKIYTLNIFFLIALISFAFVWYTQVTKTSQNVEDFTRKTLTSLRDIKDISSRSTIVDQVLKGKAIIDGKTYQTFYKQRVDDYEKRNDIDRYNKKTYEDFVLIPKSPPSIPINNRTAFILANNVYKVLLIGIQAFLLIGVANLYFFKSKHIKTVTSEYMVFVLVGLSLIFMIVALPYVSQAYNFDRLYMQSMMFLSPLIITGGLYFFYRILRKLAKIGYVFIALFVVLTYWYSYGLIWQFVGGKTVVWLNNFGFHYDIAYTHQSEVMSAQWLSSRYERKQVYTNATGRNILWAYGSIDTVNSDVFPATLDKASYVYATYANVVNDINYFFYRGSHLGYEYPKRFVNDQKNKIYNNGTSEIYQ